MDILSGPPRPPAGVSHTSVHPSKPERPSARAPQKLGAKAKSLTRRPHALHWTSFAVPEACACAQSENHVLNL